MFVSLVALTAQDHYVSRPVVLIDEIERHLHYDAQADLIQVFAKQSTIPQIVYTTHSAGCLPEDLGVGVRAVEHIAGSNHSRVHNRFWTQGEGFSPLLMGMGASTLAFVPLRSAVLTEGASDLILLPTLFREVLDARALGFQIAPATPQAPASRIAGLEHEAPNVVWLHDHDEGGRSFRDRLLQAGVPRSRVIALAATKNDLVLEDLIARDVYLEAVAEELRRGGVEVVIPPSAVGDSNRPKALQQWAEENRLRLPNKVAVANRIVERRLDYERLVEPKRVATLRTLHRRLTAALGSTSIT